MRPKSVPMTPPDRDKPAATTMAALRWESEGRMVFSCRPALEQLIVRQHMSWLRVGFSDHARMGESETRRVLEPIAQRAVKADIGRPDHGSRRRETGCGLERIVRYPCALPCWRAPAIEGPVGPDNTWNL